MPSAAPVVKVAEPGLIGGGGKRKREEKEKGEKEKEKEKEKERKEKRREREREREREKRKKMGEMGFLGFSDFEIRIYSIFDFSKKNLFLIVLRRNFNFKKNCLKNRLPKPRIY